MWNMEKNNANNMRGQLRVEVVTIEVWGWILSTVLTYIYIYRLNVHFVYSFFGLDKLNKFRFILKLSLNNQNMKNIMC